VRRFILGVIGDSPTVTCGILDDRGVENTALGCWPFSLGTSRDVNRFCTIGVLGEITCVGAQVSSSS